MKPKNQDDLLRYIIANDNLKRYPYRPQKRYGIDKLIDEFLAPYAKSSEPLTRKQKVMLDSANAARKRPRRASMPPAASGAGMGWMDLIQMLMPANKRGNYTDRWNAWLREQIGPRNLDA